MAETEGSRWRSGVTPLIVALALVPSLATAEPPAIGSILGDLSLPGLDASEYALSERDGPTVLVLFRGVW